jgi:glycosyltransferase involved in cell wall biosynthesis
MKLLIITQEIDEDGDLLGFFANWVILLSHHFEQIDVFYMRGKGMEMPENVKLHKISGCKSAKTWQINRRVSQIQPTVILTHMCPEFVIAIFPSAALYEIPIVMFHAHGAITKELQIAEKIATKVITSTESGFRVLSKKKVVLSQGIDCSKFYSSKGWYIFSAGRLSPIKDNDVVIEAFAKLKNKVHLEIAGEDPYPEKETLAKLQKLIFDRKICKKVALLGSIPNTMMPKMYSECLFFVSASRTGSLDKTALEAMASGKPVLVCNEAFNEILRDYEKECIFEKGDVKDLAKKMQWLLNHPNEARWIGDELKLRVRKQHSLKNLMKNMSKEIKAVVK